MKPKTVKRAMPGCVLIKEDFWKQSSRGSLTWSPAQSAKGKPHTVGAQDVSSNKVEASTPRGGTESATGIRPLLIRYLQPIGRVGVVGRGEIGGWSSSSSRRVARSRLFPAQGLAPIELGRLVGVLLCASLARIVVVLLEQDVRVVGLAALRLDAGGGAIGGRLWRRRRQVGGGFLLLHDVGDEGATTVGRRREGGGGRRRRRRRRRRRVGRGGERGEEVLKK